MRFVGVLLLGMLVVAGTAFAEEPDAEDRVFLETQVPPDPAFVHQELRLALRIGLDRAFFEAQAIQLFRQTLDVPVQVVAPWLEELPGAEALPALPVAGDTRSLVLNGDVRQAERVGEETRDGRTFTVYRVEARYIAAEPVSLDVSAPVLRFAYATRFEEDFLGGRVAEDRRDVDVAGEARTLAVRALPEEGRPEAFVDAVGRFTIRADADPAQRSAEGAFSLRVTIEGEGNLAELTPPASGRLRGFHVYGAIDEYEPGRRVVTYEIAPLSDDKVAAVPALPFAYFDPSPPAKYRVVETKPIPLPDRVPAPTPAPAPAPDGTPARRNPPTTPRSPGEAWRSVPSSAWWRYSSWPAGAPRGSPSRRIPTPSGRQRRSRHSAKP